MFDLGTGLRYFGAGQPKDGTFRASCLLSHMHWDHTQGLPFFVPTLVPGSQFDVYGPLQDDGRTLHDTMHAALAPPVFPVELAALPGLFRFHDTGDAEFDIDDFRVTSRLIPHVGATLGFRVEIAGVKVAYLPDHQMPYDGSFSLSDGAAELCDGVDLLIHDAQYTPEEFVHKNTWGHCTMEYAVWVARESGVRRLALFHHDPVRHDDRLDELAVCMSRLGRSTGCEVFAAHEGQVVELPAA